jgi:hypothetical protein
MLGASFVLYINRGSRQSTESQKYVTIHSVMVFFYVAMFVLIFDGYPINVFRAYFLMLYAAIATVVAIDGYLEFKAHVEPMLKSKEMRTDPNTPYSNMVRLREEIFSTLGGDIRIVDKHFNSQALSNLHRLLESSLQSIKSIEILTSRDMLDSGFNENYTDFKNELNNRGIALNLMLMGEADSAAQHERFIFDGTRAYKIPPLNIINRKSEHIVSLGQGEAERRFDALTKNAIKYDNYVVRQARDNNR